jgi:hypothetical protein
MADNVMALKPLTIQINRPASDEAVMIGANLPVSGLAYGRGMPEPIIIQTVTVQVDNGAPIELIPHLIQSFPPPPIPVWSFSTSVTVPGPQGIHTIQVLSFDDLDRQQGHATVAINAGGVTFDGTATLRTDYGEATGPFSIHIDVGLIFYGFGFRGNSVAVVSFPPLTAGDSSDTVTVNLIGGGTGQFNPYSGVMSLPVVLSFHHSISEFSNSTLQLSLTTGAATPAGPFSDQGKAMQADGSITLVGDGTFVGGTPLGGHNASLILVGTMSPSPRIAVDKLPT